MQCRLSLAEGGSLRIVNGAGIDLAVDSGVVWLPRSAMRASGCSRKEATIGWIRDGTAYARASVSECSGFGRRQEWKRLDALRLRVTLLGAVMN
jgi:hypothetical protein